MIELGCDYGPAGDGVSAMTFAFDECLFAQKADGLPVSEQGPAATDFRRAAHEQDKAIGRCSLGDDPVACPVVAPRRTLV